MQKTFFNLPSAGTASHANEHIFGLSEKHNVQTNWRTFEDQPLSLGSLIDVFAGRIPVVRVPDFLTEDEREKMLQIVKEHQLGSYDTENTWPRVGVAGITQYDHISGRLCPIWSWMELVNMKLILPNLDKERYFALGEEARSLQNRWKNEVGVDVIDRVIAILQKTANMPVRLATEGDKEYFAGVLRAIDRGIGVHADFAPYEAAGWEIGKIAAQLTWNILFNKVPGGDTLIYDRLWQAPDDDLAWRKEFPRDSYHPQMLQGHPFKAMKAVPGDLTFFNPRNFHEVKACDTSRDHPVPAVRFTVSSFVGFLPGRGSQPDTLVLWS